MNSSSRELRLKAFCSERGPEIFHSIAQRNEIWRRDPFDIDSIHAPARESFRHALDKALAPPGLPYGRILLLLGESGSGKTHLIRAFRDYLHARGLGYLSYMQMTSQVSNYGRYVLANTIESLDQPYDHTRSDQTGLMRLSNALVSAKKVIDPEELRRLRTEEDFEALADLIFELTDRLVVSCDELAGIDQDLIRALLYLQRNHPTLKASALKFLRCEDMSERERRRLGGMVPKTEEQDPQTQVELLARLIWSVECASCVICLDQLEDMYSEERASEEQFRRVMLTVREISDRVPSSIIVIACLDDYYIRLKNCLSRSVIDRLETDPEPLRLAGHKSRQDLENIVSRRLQHLYREMQVPHEPAEPVFPFQGDQMHLLVGLRIRDVLDICRDAQRQSIRTGKPPRIGEAVPVEPVAAPVPAQAVAQARAPVVQLEQLWNDYRSASRVRPSENENDRTALLSWALKGVGHELTSGHTITVMPRKNVIHVTIEHRGEAVADFYVALCERSPLGEGLRKQITAAQNRAFERPLSVVRSTEFPQAPGTPVGRKLREVVQDGGRLVVVEDSTWRAMLALREFRQVHGDRPEYHGWSQDERPLTQLAELRRILDLDSILYGSRVLTGEAEIGAPALGSTTRRIG